MFNLQNIDGDDVDTLVLAGRVLQASGHEHDAIRMDKMARKALATQYNTTYVNGEPRWRKEKRHRTWRDMPTTLLREPRL